MHVTLVLKDRNTDFEAENLVAATRVFPYWTFYLPEKDGDTKRTARFIAMDRVLELYMDMDISEGEPEQKLKVVPFPGGDESSDNITE